MAIKQEKERKKERGNFQQFINKKFNFKLYKFVYVSFTRLPFCNSKRVGGSNKISFTSQHSQQKKFDKI